MSSNMTFPKRRVLKKWARFSIMSIVIIFFACSIHIIYNSFNHNKQLINKLLYSYNIKQNIDYNVSLFNNSYIDTNTLGENETYISDLVKQININYKYDFSGSKLTPLTYTYNVKAIINGEYSIDEEESKVWTKEYQLIKETTNTINDKTSINIKQPINIDFNYYNNVVSDFRKELKLPITASLNIVFSIKVTGNEENQIINDQKEMILNIPLNQQAFKITEKLEETYANNIVPKLDKTPAVNYRKLIAGIVLSITAIFIFILLFREIFNIPRKNKYTSKLNKILKEYGDVIVEIINPVNEEDMNIVEVKNFNEMIDLEEELRVPIMFYESIEYLEGEFTLIHNNILYKFTLKNE